MGQLDGLKALQEQQRQEMRICIDEAIQSMRAERTTMSEETYSIPLPWFPKEPGKLHIRKFLLPFRNGSLTGDSRFGFNRGFGFELHRGNPNPNRLPTLPGVYGHIGPYRRHGGNEHLLQKPGRQYDGALSFVFDRLMNSRLSARA